MMNREPWYKHYLWLVLVVILFAVGASIYFQFQPLGLTFVLSAVMLILAMENSDMIEAVEMYPLQHSKWKPFLVHFKSQSNIALFIFYYHIFIYVYLGLFGLLTLLFGIENELFVTVINILLIGFFLLAAGVILIRRIHVGSKYESN